MEHIYDTLIIGGGPAGYTAALYASRAGLDTLLVEKIAAGGQMALTDIIDNYPGFDEGVEGFELGMRMQAGAERFGTQTVYAEVVSVELTGAPKRVTTTEGDFYAETVIIATGADPRELGLDSERALIGKGVHYCAHCDGRFYKDKTVVVVGGGNSAVSDALYLSRLAKKVHLVHRRDTLRATKLYHEPLLRAENVEFHWNSTVTQIMSMAENGMVSGVMLKNMQTEAAAPLACNGVFVSIGRTPNTALLKGQLALDDAGYIIADESTKTNLPGVFAVGDVRTKALRQVITAASDGAVAAHFAEAYLM